MPPQGTTILQACFFSVYMRRRMEILILLGTASWKDLSLSVWVFCPCVQSVFDNHFGFRLTAISSHPLPLPPMRTQIPLTLHPGDAILPLHFAWVAVLLGDQSPMLQHRYIKPSWFLWHSIPYVFCQSSCSHCPVLRPGRKSMWAFISQHFTTLLLIFSRILRTTLQGRELTSSCSGGMGMFTSNIQSQESSYFHCFLARFFRQLTVQPVWRIHAVQC